MDNQTLRTRLLPGLKPTACADRSHTGCTRALSAAQRALQAERRRVGQGHWAASGPRCAALRELCGAELAGAVRAARRGDL